MSEYNLYHMDDKGKKVDLSDKQEDLAEEAIERSADKMDEYVKMAEEEYMDKIYPRDFDEYIVDGAILTCDQAIGDECGYDEKGFAMQSSGKTTVLHVTGESYAKACGYLYHATVKDRKLGVNIKPFLCNCRIGAHTPEEKARVAEDKLCQTEGNCRALINLNDDWDNLPSSESYFLYWNEENRQVFSGITMSSILFCKHGGIITAETSGQEARIYTAIGDIDWYVYNLRMIRRIKRIDPKFNDLIKQFKEAYEKNKSRYVSLAKQMDIPPELLAVIHYRENSDDYMKGGFNVYLHNGDPLGQPTVSVPYNKLFYDFDKAALDAISEKADAINKFAITYDTQDMAALLCFLETYNGRGYYLNNRINPYLYSGTNIYVSGKYTSDHHYDPNEVDNQAGCYILLDALFE